jgi:hypothetical protein
MSRHPCLPNIPWRIGRRNRFLGETWDVDFIDNELFGRPSDTPYAMFFPRGGPLPRHPSRLYEAIMEGAVFFILLWVLRKRPFWDGIRKGFSPDPLTL